MTPVVELRVTSLSSRLCGLLAVIVVSASVCLLGCFAWKGVTPISELALSHTIVLVVGAVALAVTHGRQISYESILSTTGIRTGGVCLFAGSALVLIPQFRNELFILPVAVAYLAVLGYETWLGTRQLQDFRPSRVDDEQSSNTTHPSSHVS